MLMTIMKFSFRIRFVSDTCKYSYCNGVSDEAVFNMKGLSPAVSAGARTERAPARAIVVCTLLPSHVTAQYY